MKYFTESIELNRDFPFQCYEVHNCQMFPHRHDCLEINYIVSGRGNYLIEEKSYPIRPGDIFIINNEERHVAFHEEPVSMHVIIFDPKLAWDGHAEEAFLKPFFSRAVNFSNRIAAAEADAKELSEYIQRIILEESQLKDGWQLIVKAALLLLLAVVNRYYDKGNALRHDTDEFGEIYERIHKVTDYIESHYYEHILLPKLARMVGMNTSYLSSSFRKIMNMTVTEYLESVRLQHACILLRMTHKTVTEIATDCGYNNVSYFNRVFRKNKAQTPLEYRTVKNQK